MLSSSPSAVRSDRKSFVPQAEARGDYELMRRVLAGDAEAFSAIVDRHARSVYALAHQMLRERSAAEDVAQEAFIALWRSRHSYRAECGSPGGWLLTITRNRAIDAIRRGRAQLHVKLDADCDREAPERTDNEALRRIEANTIFVALSTLPQAQRQALELSYYDGLSQTEISARLGVPLGTVKSRKRLALRKLAAELGSPAADSLPPSPERSSRARIP